MNIIPRMAKSMMRVVVQELCEAGWGGGEGGVLTMPAWPAGEIKPLVFVACYSVVHTVCQRRVYS